MKPLKLKDLTTLTCWDLVQQVAGLRLNVLLYGPPSTGKTFAALFAGLKPTQEAYAITLTEETPAAEVRGVFSPHPTGLRFLYGPGTLAMQTGGRFVANELDRASNDALTFMYLLAESPKTAVLRLPNNEVVHPAEGYHVWATMNGDPYRDLPEALHTRFGVKILVDRINPAALAPFPKAWRPVIERLCLVEDEARRTYLREWYAWHTLYDTVGPAVAAAAVFGARASDLMTAFYGALDKGEPS